MRDVRRLREASLLPAALSRPPSASLLKSPYTEIPGPYGQSAAVEAVGSVAAPFLAGFTFALIGLILQTGDEHLRWPDQALAFLMLAALLLIAAVHCAFTAKRYYVSPADWAGWEALAAEGRKEHLEQQVAHFLGEHRRWLEWARYAYNLGVMVLFFAIAVALVPPGPIGDLSTWRHVAIGLALLGLLAEAWGTFAGEVEKRRAPRP